MAVRWQSGYVAVDWGTTNRRAYCVDGAGALRGEMADDLGVLAIPPEGFGAAIAEIRGRFGNLPLLLAGMIGSNRGWREAVYVRCPAGLSELVRGMTWVTDDTLIVPGMSFVGTGIGDVMRGEELQVIGAVAAGHLAPDAAVCHPGTHAKWISVSDGRIDAFRTLMTGEIYGLLKEHSILSGQLQARVEAGPAFAEGVARALSGAHLLAELFSVRARALLGMADDEAAASYASGLLIGTDIAFGNAFVPDGPVTLIGRPDLCELYAAALAQAGRATTTIDGAEAFLAGANAVAEQL